MLNFLWLGLLTIGFIVAFFNGRIDIVTDELIKSCNKAIEFTISIAGIMCFWTGIMEIARESGMIKSISAFLRPVIRVLFPGSYKNDMAMGAVMMNISANILGLGNAATPFGIEAMKELQKENKDKGIATDSMCMFLVLNTSCIQLVPATLIALRSAVGSSNPTGIIGSVWIVSSIALVIAILITKILMVIYRKHAG